MDCEPEGKPLTLRSRVETYGYAVLPNVLEREEVRKLLEKLGETNLHRSRAGARHLMKHNWVAQVANDKRFMAIAREILGGTPIAFRATLFDKSPASNWLVMWHQDTALPLSEKRELSGWGPWSTKDSVIYAHAPASALEQVIALRLHLDDSTIANGPLRVLSGTHTLGVLTDGEISKLAGETPAVDCEVSQGGIVAMRPLVLHASSKARNETPRRVLHFEYAATDWFDGMKLAVV
jgi:ectoine hydroxylase-related dioxygenase (phytanoyl-CoA dioxygenase family)